MNAYRVIALGFVALAANLLACSHDVESPPATGKTVAPDLVCVEQLTTSVTLTGSGFTPMPSKTLEKSPELLLPQVEIDRTQDLAGKPASGTTKIPDDPANPSKSQLHWVSEQQMSFTVTPELMAAPGLYDVVVTNPDGKHKAVFSSALAAVPRPTLAAVMPDILCDDEEDQTVTVSGMTILQVGPTMPVVHVSGNGTTKDYPITKVDACTDVPGMHAEGEVKNCGNATFTLPQGALTPGQYSITLTNPAPANCVSSETINFTVVPKPTIVAIAPDLVCDAQGDQSMTLTGTGFLQLGMALPSVTVGQLMLTPTGVSMCTPVTGTFVEGAAQSCTSMTFTLPQGSLMPGDYPVVVTNPPPADCHSEEMIDLHVAPPPSIGSVNPLAVCDAQGDQVVTIAGSGFIELQMGTSAPIYPTVTIGAQMFAPTSATGCMTVMGMFTEGTVSECTGLVVTVPKGTFSKGMYPVSVKNPPPADCVSMEPASLVIDDPPTIASVVPGTLCAGGGTLNIDGTGFLQTASVELTSSGQPALASGSTIVNMAGTQITATFGGPLTVGSQYTVVVDNGDGCTATAPPPPVTVVTGPIAFFADPEIVYSGINTRVTVYLTTLELPATVTITPAGMASPVTTLQVNPVTGHPNRIQAVIPEGQAAGVYDLHVSDATGCPTVLPNAITVTNQLKVTLKSVVPPFGYNLTDTPITVLRDKNAPATANAPFAATPRVFLNPTNPQPTDVAIQVQSVSFVDGDTLTAVVPKNEPVHAYDLIVVNPDGTVGYLADAFTVQSSAPPTISAVTPSSIVDASGQVVTVSGQSFNGSTVSLSCADAMGNPIATAPAVVSGADNCGAGGCTQTATIDGSGLPVGAVCVLRETNTDGSYFDFSAVGVTNSSLNLPAPHAGTSLNVGRRALVAAAGNATSSARFVYAIGGDPGAAMANMPLSSTEFASVDLFGKLGAWSLQPASALGTPRSFAASTTVGRYIYVAGGSDGTNALASAERAMILSPREVPQMDIDDLVPNAAGLGAGYWLYRVSATFSAGDADNPGGESLPSDEFVVKLPTFGSMKIQVVLAWTAPVDALGAPLPNVSGYNIYRTPMVDGSSGGEVLIASVSGTTLKYTDDGTATPGAQTPLPLGSTGKWAPLPAMASTRKGAAGAAAVDPADPTKIYFYALLGLDQANTALTSYEYLPITLQPNGRHAVGTWTAGAQQSSAGRWQLGAFVADHTVSTNVPAGSTYVYLGAGVSAAEAGVTKVEAGLVAAGGDLGALNGTIKSFSSTVAGYGVCAANDQLFTFGGANAAPSSGATSATITSPAPGFVPGAWNAEGLALTNARYLMGSAVQSAFIFLVAGQTNLSQASTTTELVIW